MAFNDIERKRTEQALDRFLERRRPAPHLRPQLDMADRIEGQSVVIFEVRPDWMDPSQTTANPVAKATDVRSRDVWKIFWQRRDLKWHGYDPVPTVGSVDKFLEVVDRDQYCCFWG